MPFRAFVAADPAAVNDGDRIQKRPLSAAVEHGHREIVRFLLDNGADPSLPEGRLCPLRVVADDRHGSGRPGSRLLASGSRRRSERSRQLLGVARDPRPLGRHAGSPVRLRRARPPGAWGYVQRGDLETVAAISAL